MTTFAILAGFALSIFGQTPDLNRSSSASKKVWAEMVGPWRVSGQPKRGSSSGAWTTQSQVAWMEKSEARLADGLQNHRSLLWTLKTGPKVGRAQFLPDPKSGEFSRMTFTPGQGKERTFGRVFEESAGRIVFESVGTVGLNDERWTFQQRSRDRWVILVEGRKNRDSDWSRTVEMGMTREGTTIAIGDGQKKCIVTGGEGDMEVTIAGKSYFVCCSGCRDALLEDPAAFIPAMK
jgi:hypothetical protein